MSAVGKLQDSTNGRRAYARQDESERKYVSLIGLDFGFSDPVAVALGIFDKSRLRSYL
ncbi:MAG: hypothetical protein ACTHKP_09685 [Nitrososphaeraceae archaeon]